MYDPLLSNLCIGELAEVVGGNLRLGTMPPLGGDLEPVGPLVVDSHHVRTGDVFWALDWAGEHGSRYAEVAFSRDAAGAVVSRRRLEPWAGKFSIEVPDTRLALWQLAANLRGRFRGSVVGVVGLETFRAGAMIRDVADVPVDRRCPVLHPDASIRVPLELLRWQADSPAAVMELPTSCSQQIQAFSHLCDPEIVVITTTRHAGTGRSVAELGRHRAGQLQLVNTLRQALPEHVWVVVAAADEQHSPRSQTGRTAPRTLQVGTGRGSELTASKVESKQGLRFELEGQAVHLPGAHRDDLNHALAAFAVGRLLGKTDRAIARALESARTRGDEETQGNRQRISEASPSVSGLRESDTTLPPGLERFAY